jgi:hypothetical protein
MQSHDQLKTDDFTGVSYARGAAFSAFADASAVDRPGVGLGAQEITECLEYASHYRALKRRLAFRKAGAPMRGKNVMRT